MNSRKKRKRFGHSSRSSRQGFTLLELLLVMAILVVLASLASLAILPMLSNSRADATRIEIQSLANSCKMYKIRVGAFPAKLEDLTTRPSGLDQSSWGGPYLEKLTVNDTWNRPYKYTPNDNNDTVLIQSAGADGQLGSEDDVSNSPTT